MDDLIVLRPQGLYCPRGDFYIDPWRPVSKAVITHAHADHARRGHDHYLAHRDCAGLLKARLGDVSVQSLDYGNSLQIGDVKVCLYPTGHVLGSAQVSVSHQGRVWVVSGDYKVEPDATWLMRGARSGPSAATLMIAATTMSTGMTSMVPSGTPGNSRNRPRA